MNKGFSTLEILIAMTILILALSSVVLIVFGNQSILVDTETEREALEYGHIYIQEHIEKARHDFRSLVPQSATSSGMYTVSLLASSTDYVSKTIQAHITWNQEFGRKRYIDIPTLVTNYEDQSSTDTCDSILSGNWMRPNIVNTTKAMKTLLGDASGIYSVTDIDVNRDKLFVTTQNASITSPVTFADTADTSDSSGTIAWSNATFARISDNNRTQATLHGFDTTHVLKLRNFDFHIPKGSTILGIKVEIERMQSGGTTGNVRDDHIRLVHGNGAFSTLNKADTGTNWSTSEIVKSYGNSNDVWGDLWSSDELNNPEFGVAVSLTGSSATTNRNASIDSVTVTVTYTHQLYVFDVSDTKHPQFISGLGTNSAVQTGFNAVTTNGPYAYIATNSGSSSGQLQIINIQQNPPVVVSTLIIPSVTGSGGQGIGKSIFYSHGYVFLGLTKTLTGPEFNIIDVIDSAQPTWIGGYRVGNAVNAIEIRNNYAHIATPNAQELITLDVSNPANPHVVGGYQAPDDIGNGKSLYTVGNTLYFGRTVTGSNPELYILDNTNPERLISSTGSYEIGSSINSLIVRDSLAFLITTNGQFQIYSIASSTHITPFTSTIALPSGGMGDAMDCEGNTLFITSSPKSGPETNSSSFSIIEPEYP